MSAILRRPTARFALAALLVISACAIVLRVHAHATDADVAAWGVTFDLTITMPLLYWFFVVRAGKARALTIAPLCLVCTIIATALVPRGQQQFLRDLARAGGAVAETLLVGAIVMRVVRFRRDDLNSADPYMRISVAARTLAGDGRVAEAIASEVTMVYYALFCWRKKVEDRQSCLSERSDANGQAGLPVLHHMTFHERNGWSTILVCILVMIAAESIGMHLLLALWKRGAAWLWTAMDAWAVIWLLGDYHALRLRRTTVDDDALHLRYGMRWSATIPLANIESIDEIRGEWKRQRDVLKVAILDDPRWLITLREPVVAHGLAGIRKTIRGIAMLPDDDAAISALRIAHATAATARADHP